MIQHTHTHQKLGILPLYMYNNNIIVILVYTSVINWNVGVKQL